MEKPTPQSHGTHAIDRQDLAIATLSIIALFLFLGLLFSARGGNTAFADGMSVSGGDYVIAVGGATLADEDYVYVVDVPMERVIAYRFDAARQQIEVVQGIELGPLRQAGSGADPGSMPTTPPRRRP